ncbi:NAD(P)-binding protein [Dentipellis sp. KUC8613]|nr:NAD(P)-binding protein [Dentipellis sp. KUC8613]
MPFTWDDLGRNQALPLPQLERYGLAGKVTIVTGGNTGIGYEIAKGLAANGAERVIIACRNEQKGAQAVKTLTEGTGRAAGIVECWPLDLASLASVRSFARRFLESGLPLHLLVNNAAVNFVPKMATEDGLDLILQVDHLAPLLLSILLYPALQRAGDKKHPSRCLWVSSELAGMAPYIGAKDSHPIRTLNQMAHEETDIRVPYQNAKISSIMTACEYARRMPASANVLVAVAMPGLVATELGQKDVHGENFKPKDLEALLKMKPRTREEGARNILVPATYPVDKVWGDNRKNVPLFIQMEAVESLKGFSEDCANEELRKVVWDDSMAVLGVKSGEVESFFL